MSKQNGGIYKSPIAKTIYFDPSNCDNTDSKNMQDAIDDLCNASAVSTVAATTWVFWRDGKGEKKWMKQYNNHVEDSQKAPIIAPFNGEITYLTMINKKNNANGAIEIYKNGSLIFTWTISGKRWAKKTNGLGSLTFSSDDQISVFIDKTSGTKLEKTQIHIGVKWTSTNSEETGSANL